MPQQDSPIPPGGGAVWDEVTSLRCNRKTRGRSPCSSGGQLVPIKLESAGRIAPMAAISRQDAGEDKAMVRQGLLRTGRLVLRDWRDSDREPFAKLSQDTEVMRYLTPMPTRAASDAWIDRQKQHLAEHGFCFWAVELTASTEFVGAIGLFRVGYQAHFTPAVEVGWRIARQFWGRGYAPEAAAVALRFGFETKGLPEIVANTVPANVNSRRVMAKLGMSRDRADDFDHPRVPAQDPLRHQILYRLSADAWRQREASL